MMEGDVASNVTLMSTTSVDLRVIAGPQVGEPWTILGVSTWTRHSTMRVQLLACDHRLFTLGERQRLLPRDSYSVLVLSVVLGILDEFVVSLSSHRGTAIALNHQWHGVAS